ncbi:MAG: hypothetical protein FWH02_07805, partial [Oscillospiraceae bacterium]|nr:hypothetical protein [Oscillospiraceae bacterium]
EFAVIIFIGTDSGSIPEYSVDESPWGPPLLIGPGTYVILDALYGSSLEMRVAPIDGYEAVWDDGSALRVTGSAYAKAVRGDMTIALGFVSLTPVTDTVDNILDEYMWLWPLIFLAIVAATIIAILVNRRGGIIGFVRCDGKGVRDVTVGYTADGEVGYSAVSKKDGRFRIKASKDTELAITSVTKSGYEAAGDLPGPMISEKKAAEMEIVMKEV